MLRMNEPCVGDTDADTGEASAARVGDALGESVSDSELVNDELPLLLDDAVGLDVSVAVAVHVALLDMLELLEAVTVEVGVALRLADNDGV